MVAKCPLIIPDLDYDEEIFEDSTLVLKKYDPKQLTNLIVKALDNYPINLLSRAFKNATKYGDGLNQMKKVLSLSTLKKVAKSNILILITAEFPFGGLETFIENEIGHLNASFDKIILISHDTHQTHRRTIPENISIIRERYSLNLIEKLLSFKNIFSKIFINELGIISSSYNKTVSFGIFKTMLFSLYNGTRLQVLYENIANKYLNENIFLYSYWSNDSAIAVALARKENPSIKSFSRIHGWDVFFEPSRYNYLPFRSLIVEHLSSIFSISEAGIKYVRQSWKIQTSNKIKLSRLAVNPQKKLTPTNKNILIVSCSSVIELKNLNLIIQELKILKNVSFKWCHFGDGDLFKEINQSANINLNISSFEFYGRVSNKFVLSWYKKNNPDLFINLSSSEGIPVSIMEAISFGIPTIATNVGGVSEIINNKNGYLIDFPFTKGAVAKRITEFNGLSFEDRNKKRIAAYETWQQKYDSRKNYTQFIENIFSI